MPAMNPMLWNEGLVREIRIWGGQKTALIACPEKAIPAPGRYLLAWATDDLEASLATPLFLMEYLPGGFLAAPACPSTWEPGTQLCLRGPIGKGFDLPPKVKKLALVLLGDSAGRLLPLIQGALDRQAAVTLYADGLLPPLPFAVEVSPLSAVPEALGWADYLALDLPIDKLTAVREVLGLDPDAHQLPCPAQVLALAAMPCGGVGECGACSLKVRRVWNMACRDGPVFEMELILSAGG